MAATLDYRIVINVLSEAQAVDRRGFGTILYVTDDNTFSGVVAKRYESNADAQADSELGDDAKASVAFLFSQPTHPGAIVVGDIDYTAIPASLNALRQDATAGGFYGLAASTRTAAHITAIAAWVEADGKALYLAQTADSDVKAATAGNVLELLTDANYGRTALCFHNDPEADFALSWLAFKLAADPDQVTTNWAYATLVGIEADSITATERQNITTNHGNVNLSLGGVTATGEGVLCDGRFIDTLISRDWFRARVTESIQQLFLDASNLNQSIPYSNVGIGALESKVRATVAQGVAIGHFEADSLVMSVPDIADVSDADRLARLLRMTANVRLTGSIESVSFNLAVVS